MFSNVLVDLWHCLWPSKYSQRPWLHKFNFIAIFSYSLFLFMLYILLIGVQCTFFLNERRCKWSSKHWFSFLSFFSNRVVQLTFINQVLRRRQQMIGKMYRPLKLVRISNSSSGQRPFELVPFNFVKLITFVRRGDSRFWLGEG